MVRTCRSLLAINMCFSVRVLLRDQQPEFTVSTLHHSHSRLYSQLPGVWSSIFFTGEDVVFLEIGVVLSNYILKFPGAIRYRRVIG